MPKPQPMRPGLSDWALFLDFDGTLVDIAERPDAIVIDPALPDILSRLQKRLGGAVAVVSGRPIAFLDQQLLPGRFDAAGLHGLDYRIGQDLYRCRPHDHPKLRTMASHLEQSFRAKPGLILEDKGCSLAIHWRLAPHEKDFALSKAQSTAASLGEGYRFQYGKAVAEILPANAGKGKIIEFFLDQSPYRGRRPVFIGDDLTDEHGFEAVNARGGVSIRVGPGETSATLRVGTPSALRHSLSIWAAGESFPFQPGALDE